MPEKYTSEYTPPYHTSLPQPTAPVRVGRISYMNVAPVYYGLDNGRRPGWMSMTSAPPAALNAMLAAGHLDISPVSSAAVARCRNDWLVLPDLSIACFGPVMSVLLVSRHPFEALDGRKVILTRDSATAAALTRCLLAARGIHPRLATGRVRTAADLPEDTGAALVIGDAALREKWSARFPHVWDLGELWRDRTGLPFVFALWAVRKSFAEEHPAWVSAVLDRFDRSKREGRRNIRRILPEAAQRLGISMEMCREYYDRLYYDLGPADIEGLAAFFRTLHEEKIIARPVRLSFFRNADGACAGSHAA